MTRAELNNNRTSNIQWVVVARGEVRTVHVVVLAIANSAQR